jgi:cytochrome c553
MKSRPLLEMMPPAAALIVTAALCAAPAPTRAQSAAVPQKLVSDGVFTEAQAARGKQAYEANTCTKCHLDTLEGREQTGGGNGGAALIGLRFVQDYGESKVSKLVNKILVDKPVENPGTLNDQVALDIAAYILMKNNYPAGRADLTNDVAGATWIPGPPGATGVATHTIVTSTGCLFKDPSNSWLLKNAADLKPVAAEASGSGSGATSTNTFRLLDAYHYDAASQAGHTVKVVGYLVRLGAEIRVSLTSLQTVASSCSQ